MVSVTSLDAVRIEVLGEAGDGRGGGVMASPLMCPHCGMTYLYDEVPHHLRSVLGNLVPEHFADEGPPGRCPGSWQNPRNAETDRRPLWKDLPAEEPTP